MGPWHFHDSYQGRVQKWQSGTEVTKVTGELGPGCCCPGWSPLQKAASGRSSHAHRVSKMHSGSKRQCEELPAKKKKSVYFLSSFLWTSVPHLQCVNNINIKDGVQVQIQIPKWGVSMWTKHLRSPHAQCMSKNPVPSSVASSAIEGSPDIIWDIIKGLADVPEIMYVPILLCTSGRRLGRQCCGVWNDPASPSAGSYSETADIKPTYLDLQVSTLSWILTVISTAN